MVQFQDSWLMMGLEIIIGVIIYGVMIIFFKAPIIDQAKKIVNDKLKNVK